MILGSHNSLTSYPSLGFSRCIGWFGNIFSRCQYKGMTIEKQLEKGVRWFNLQVTKHGNRWVGSHGLMLYNVNLHNVMLMLDDFAKTHKGKKDKIYVQLYLDKNFTHKVDHAEFEILCDDCMSLYKNVIFQRLWNEQDNIEMMTFSIDGEERFWSRSWSEGKGRKWYERIPFLKKWTKKYKDEWIRNCTHEYLMMDFI